MYLNQMLTLFLPPFLMIWGGLLILLVIHVGWVNAKGKVWDWPLALYCVAITDPKTRNDFWHLVVNALIIAIFAVMILYVLGKLHHA